MNRAFVLTLGCDKNRVDGEILIGTLRGAGYDVLSGPEGADAIIVNTCGFIKVATADSIDAILEMAAHKPKALIIAGCMAERYRDEIKKSLPEVSAIVGAGQPCAVLAEVDRLLERPPSTAVDPIAARLAARTDDLLPHISYIKIAEGCDNACTYCTIPAIRGAYKSRTIQDIVDEAGKLAADGARELALIAQDTAAYGIDIYGTPALPRLLTALKDIPARLRLMYANPQHISDELIETMAAQPNICKYIDMPIQHSAPSVLHRMGRPSTDLSGIMAKLRLHMPHISIRTTIMVGFPGETATEFDALVEFIKEAQFDRLGVFPYSREEGTAAAHMDDQIADPIKLARLDAIMKHQQKIHFAKQSALVGQTIEAMIDGRLEDGTYAARAWHDAHEVDGIIIVETNATLTAGDLVNVTLTATRGYDLIGSYADGEHNKKIKSCPAP